MTSNGFAKIILTVLIGFPQLEVPHRDHIYTHYWESRPLNNLLCVSAHLNWESSKCFITEEMTLFNFKNTMHAVSCTSIQQPSALTLWNLQQCQRNVIVLQLWTCGLNWIVWECVLWNNAKKMYYNCVVSTGCIQIQKHPAWLV